MEALGLLNPVISIVTMLFAAGALATLYWRLNLSNHSFALALPKGSVRAILALGLVVIFTVVSWALMSDPSMKNEYEKVGSFSGLSQEEYNAYEQSLGANLQVAPLPNGTGNELTYSGDLYRVKISKNGLDLSKQILTALITALSVVIGFYFGSRTVSPNPVDPELPGNHGRQTLAGQTTEIFAGMERKVETIAAVEESLEGHLVQVQDRDIKELVSKEYEEISNQQSVAQNAVASAGDIMTQIIASDDESELTTLTEQLQSAAETVERNLAQVQAAMRRAEDLLI